jgi:hypothetical protein
MSVALCRRYYCRCQAPKTVPSIRITLTIKLKLLLCKPLQHSIQVKYANLRTNYGFRNDSHPLLMAMIQHDKYTERNSNQKLPTASNYYKYLLVLQSFNPFQSNFSATRILPSSYLFWAGKRLMDYLSLSHSFKTKKKQKQKQYNLRYLLAKVRTTWGKANRSRMLYSFCFCFSLLKL